MHVEAGETTAQAYPQALIPGSRKDRVFTRFVKLCNLWTAASGGGEVRSRGSCSDDEFGARAPGFGTKIGSGLCEVCVRLVFAELSLPVEVLQPVVG